MPSIAAQKRLLRTEAGKRRDLAASNGDIGAKLIDMFERHIDPPSGTAISGYYPIGGEANILSLLNALRDRGFDIALPVVDKPQTPLIFRRWDEGVEMKKGVFGILEPGPDATVIRPDMILAPLLAFDRRGNRLGYGGGFYDMSIRSIREHQPVYALGVAYAAQEVPAVPCDKNDMALDGVLTEKGVIRPESEPS